MYDDSARLQVAQWILERNLHWIAAAEVKTGVVVALDTAMLAALAAVFSSLPPSEQTAYMWLLAAVPAVCLGAAILCAALSVLPRVSGPDASLIFFGKIVKKTAPAYLDAFRGASEADLLEDCLAQVYRNAEIACDKFYWVRASMTLSFIAVSPWMVALGVLVALRASS